MSFSMPRAGGLAMVAIVLFLGCAGAGELARPVPPDAQVTRFTRFNIRYSLRDIVADGVQKVEFYITDDMGLTWRLYGEDPDRMSPMTVQVPGEGVYGFVCIVTDRYGNREREPVARTHPETVIVVDRTPPTAKWLAPLQDILGKGQAVELKWEASDPYFGQGPVRLQYAVNANGNHDRDAVWESIQENLAAAGSINWTPPATASARYNFRLIAEDRAGNMAYAYNPATVVVDVNPPVITSVSPLRSNRLENNIMVEANDGGGSGVKEISLYVSPNSGGTWALVKETNDTGESVPVLRRPGSAIPYTAPRSGSYALWPVVFDEAGNATSLPAIGNAGPYVLVIDTEPPNVSLSSSFLMGRAAVLSNESRRVEWTAYDPNIREYSAVISLSLDNGQTWQELRSGLPASGSETINFPFGAQSEDAKLKVSVSDEFGNVGEDVSTSFKLTNAATAIDSVTPVTQPSTTGGWPGSYGGDAGAPPAISPPSPVFTPSPGPQDSTPFQPLSPIQPGSGGTPAPYGAGSAPAWGQQPSGFPAPSSSPAWGQPAPASPWSTPYGAGPVEGESAAASIPNAMIGGGTSASEGTGAIPMYQLSPQPSGAGVPQTPSAPPPATSGWQPSPTAGRQTPSAPSGLPPLGGTSPSSPASGTGTGLALPLPPPGQPTDSGAQAPTSFAPSSSPFQGFDSAPLAPPPLPGTSSPPPPPSPTQSGMPPLAGMPSAPPTPSTSLFDEGPSLPLSDLRPPSASQTPSSPPAETPPSAPALPGLPGESGLAAPQPLGATAPGRPVNKREQSNFHLRRSKAHQEEGVFNLAIQEANAAMSADDKNPAAFMQLSQLLARNEPPEFARAGITARAAAELDGGWEGWWNCAEIFYIWAHAKNREVLAQLRTGQRPPERLVDERNQALTNARLSIAEAASKAQSADAASRKKVATTQGLIVYLQAMTIPEPVAPEAASGPAVDAYRRDMQEYKRTTSPVLLEALPYFQNAMTLDGSPAYSETFHIGVINYRLGNIEKNTGNNEQAAKYYLEAVNFLERATTSRDVPKEGPREAWYMLAHCYDLLSQMPIAGSHQYVERALRYWNQTIEYYDPGSSYYEYGTQRIDALSRQMGR